MSVIANNIVAGAAGQGGVDATRQIDRSLRFNSSDSAYLSKTFSSAGNRKTWTLSFWVKLCGSSGHLISAGNDAFQMEIRSDGQYLIANSGCFSNTYSTAVFRDYSAWQHFVIEHDATNTYCKIYVNGSLQKTISASNADGAFNNNTAHNFNGRSTSLDSFTDFYLAEVHFVDGTARDASDFGEYDDNNVWQPKTYSGSYGTNGFHLSFPTDQKVDYSGLGTGTFENSDWGFAFNGNYQWSTTHNPSANSNQFACPANNTTINWTGNVPVASGSTVLVYYVAQSTATGQNIAVNGTNLTLSSSGNSDQVFSADVTSTVGSAITSLSTSRVVQNGGALGIAGITIDGVPLLDIDTLGYDSSGNKNHWTANNLVATAGLDTAAQGFDVVTWTANGSNQSITSLGFQPDLIWAKSSNTGNTPHLLVDSVRGVSKALSSHSTGAEEDYSGISGVISSFNSDGFDTGGNSDIATNNRTFVAWCWKAGGTAVSNTDGSITSSVSANTTYGFSIVSYTGNGSAATIGHGLSKAPKVIIKKFRSATSSWDVYHESVGAGKRLVLNTAATEATTSSYQNVNSSTFDVHAGNNDNGVSMIAYCWSEVPGFSKFGEYSGACSSSVTVKTGFKPKFVIIKGKDVDSSPSGYRGWGMYQEPVTSQQLMAHCSGEEGVRGNCGTGSDKRDIQANVVFNNDGFTVDSCWFEQNDNTSNAKYVYMAFADKPPGEIIDSLIDTPTNYEADSGNNGGNYCTLNPLDNATTLSNGNLTITGSSSSFKGVRSTIGMSSGKWYMECKVTAYSSSTSSAPGIWNGDDTSLNTGGGSYGNAYLFVTDYASNYRIYTNKGSSNPYSQSGSISAGDIIGIALDLDNGKCYVHINGTYLNSGNSVYSTWPADTYYFGGYEYTSGNQLDFNFGQRPFAYTPRTGHKSLCTTNLADPTIAKGSEYFDTKLWTGNSSTQTISGYEFSPDFVWIKVRSESARSHFLFDTIRGTAKALKSDASDAEQTYSTSLTAFNSDGFDLGAWPNVNNNTKTIVGWAWDAGSSNTSVSVGGLNSSSYNTSQNWSSNYSGNNNVSPTQAFNGLGPVQNGYAHQGASLTLTFNPALSGRFIVYGGSGGGGADDYTISDGTNTTTLSSNQSYASAPYFEALDFGDQTGITSLTCSAGYTLYGIRVAGKLLVDSNVTPPNVPSIATTVRANPSAGFSIAEYTGNASNSTIAHGLNAAPELIIIKLREDASGWAVYHDEIGTSTSNYIELQSSSGAAQDNTAFQNKAPTSSVFSIGTKAAVNNSGDSHIAYCFAPVEGYSAFGSYTGNGSTNGPFVFTGFKPKWVMIKRNDGEGDWRIWDTSRDPINVADNKLYPNKTDAETGSSDTNEIDILSNGFKLRSSVSEGNSNGGTYIYAAFAENPFKTARAR